MSATTSTSPEAIRIPIAAWLLAMMALIAAYVILQENGALLASSSETLHEFFHDGRHAVGMPCH